MSVAPCPNSTGMSRRRPCPTCQAGPFFLKYRYMSTPLGPDPSGHLPVTEPSASASLIRGSSAFDWAAPTPSSCAHSTRGTPCGPRLSLRSFQVICGASAS